MSSFMAALSLSSSFLVVLFVIFFFFFFFFFFAGAGPGAPAGAFSASSFARLLASLLSRAFLSFLFFLRLGRWLPPRRFEGRHDHLRDAPPRCSDATFHGRVDDVQEACCSAGVLVRWGHGSTADGAARPGAKMGCADRVGSVGPTALVDAGSVEEQRRLRC